MNGSADGIAISIIIPVYNSAASLRQLYERLTATMEGIGQPYEIIMIEDCGPDDAWDVLVELATRDERLSAMQLMRNSGQGSALLCGLSYARGEIVVTLDDDLQHPPEEIPRLLAALAETPRMDVVIGVPERRRHAWWRNLGSRALDRMNSWMLGKDPNLTFSNFRAIRRDVVTGLLAMRATYPAIGVMLWTVTRRMMNVTVRHDRRLAGRSGYTLPKLMLLMLSNWIGFSVLPLRVLSTIGALGIAASIVYAIVLLVKYFTAGIHVQGWTSMALLLITLSGFTFLGFGILGEYQLRILQLLSSSTQYHVRQRVAGGRRECVK